MRNIIILLLLILSTSCSVKQKAVEKQKESYENKTEGTSTVDIKKKINEESIFLKDSVSKGFDIEITAKDDNPCGLLTKFEFTDGDKVYKGTTNGQIKTKSREDKKSVKKESKKQIEIVYKVVNIYKTHTTYKSQYTKKKEKSFGSPIALSVIIGLIVAALAFSYFNNFSPISFIKSAIKRIVSFLK